MICGCLHGPLKQQVPTRKLLRKLRLEIADCRFGLEILAWRLEIRPGDCRFGMEIAHAGVEIADSGLEIGDSAQNLQARISRTEFGGLLGRSPVKKLRLRL